LILANPNDEFVAHRMWPGAGREERFCDEFAAALLFPRSWIARFTSEPHSLRTARVVADASDASLSAAVVRLRTVLEWRSSLLLWRRIDARWRLSSTAGVPASLHNRITSEQETGVVLDCIQRTGRHDQDCRLPLRILGSGQVVDAELSVRGSSGIALARLEAKFIRA
jgi:hypothetical protein